MNKYREAAKTLAKPPPTKKSRGKVTREWKADRNRRKAARALLVGTDGRAIRRLGVARAGARTVQFVELVLGLTLTDAQRALFGVP